MTLILLLLNELYSFVLLFTTHSHDPKQVCYSLLNWAQFNMTHSIISCSLLRTRKVQVKVQKLHHLLSEVINAQPSPTNGQTRTKVTLTICNNAYERIVLTHKKERKKYATYPTRTKPSTSFTCSRYASNHFRPIPSQL